MSAPIAFNRLVPELNCSDFARSLAFLGETLGCARLMRDAQDESADGTRLTGARLGR